MYVCICRAVTDHAIRRCVDEGATSLRDLRRELGLGTQCGRCIPQARAVLREALAERAVCQDADIGFAT